MEAAELKKVDTDYRNHLQAFLNFAVKAEKKTGKNKSEPVYKQFKQFYNYETELKNVKKENKKRPAAPDLCALEENNGIF